jgi:hypothetical protein
VPFIPFLVALLLVFVLVLVSPVLLVIRYKVGTARRPARRWIITANSVSLLISAGLFLWVASITNFWVRNAFASSLLGFAAGVLLGLLGVKLIRWEQTSRALYYTPNRWLVLFLTLAVAARLLYGFWRIWHAWRTTAPDSSWLASAGIPGSMAVGALVLGYYFTYFAGVRWRLR